MPPRTSGGARRHPEGRACSKGAAAAGCVPRPVPYTRVMPSAPAPRGPPGRLLTGHLAEFRADRLAFFTRCAREYGDVVPLRIVRHRVLLLSHPDLIEQMLVGRDKSGAKPFIKHFGLRLYGPILGNGLVTSEGDFWRRQRKPSARRSRPAGSRPTPARWSPPPSEWPTSGTPACPPAKWSTSPRASPST